MPLSQAAGKNLQNGDAVAFRAPTHPIAHGAIQQGRKDLTLVRMTPDIDASANQDRAVLREPGIAAEAAQLHKNGGAIALGHPLGMSGARITGPAARGLSLSGDAWDWAMRIGVGGTGSQKT